jgi:uracil-DNA glycosylase
MGYVPASGPGSNGILLVGEAAGETEADWGKPFVGAAGFYLDRVLRRAGLNRDTYRVHNVLSCRPPNNYLANAPYEAEAIASCGHFLNTTINQMKPKVIVPLGDIALQRMTGYKGITRYRGRVIMHPNGAWIVPTYHPSFLLPRKGQAKTSKFVGAVIRDLRYASQIAKEGFAYKHRAYTLDPTADEFAMWANEFFAALERDPDLYLSFDIETPMKLKKKDEDEFEDDEEETDEEEEVKEGEEPSIHEPILRISFSYRVGTAVSVPFQGPWLDTIRKLLACSAGKVVWNGARFDVPVLEANGYHVGGVIFDFMWGWHLLQSDLPKGLEYVSSFFTDILPWKHESESQPAWYNAVDADAALENAIGITRELKALNQWDIFLRHIVQLDPLLYQVGRQGVHIEIAAQNALKEKLEREQHERITRGQESIPWEVFPRKRYKGRPQPVLTDFDVHGETWTRVEHRRYEPVEVAGKAKFCTACRRPAPNKSEHQKGKGNPCKGASLELLDAVNVEYDEVLDFNPNSVKDLTEYAAHFGHPLGVNHKTKRPTMDKRHVEKLAAKHEKKHPIYRIALDLRAVKKTLGTYVVGFKPDEHGKIYTTLGHHPSTLRLSSRAKNLQNVSHRGSALYAEDVRRTIIPSPGKVFVEADSSAIEAVLTGYFMGSQWFIELARKSIHAYLTCFELGWEFNPENVDRVKLEHKNAYDRNKQVVYLSLYGGTPGMMAMTYPQFFSNVRKAEEAQKRLFEACPGLAQWQTDTRMFAHKQGYLINPWNYRHYFYHVYSKDREGNITLGDDAKRCVAYLPQSAAAAFMKDNVIILAGTKFWPMPANGLVHDSYCLEVEQSMVDEAVEVLAETLTRPVPELGDLRIGCEIKVGYNWADMKMIRKVSP